MSIAVMDRRKGEKERECKLHSEDILTPFSQKKKTKIRRSTVFGKREDVCARFFFFSDS